MLILFTDKKTDSNTFINKAIKEYCKFYDIPFFNYDIIRNENKKPLIVPQKLFFNLTHSNIYTLCAVSCREVGIDLQYIDKNVNIKEISNRFLNKEIKDTNDFFEYWVKAEALAKLEGVSICTKLYNDNNNSLIVKFIENYYLAIASEDKGIYFIEDYEQY
jgi:phosphopantetheinyl transferase